jgi:hypothetical protein|tara:strand:- start:1762 stop:2025 length:264 start_codon:yes stop_codon:yes gene_type:complete
MNDDKDPLDDIVKTYEDLIMPVNWIKIFPTMEDFRKWILLGTIQDIERTIKEFEEYELYEHCAVMLDVLKERKARVAEVMGKIKKQK